MEQLPGLFIYVCVAVFVPIALARFVVRAEWRTIGTAALIWYGFLFLATGSGLHSQEALGWAFILAMFLSIPALPVIALALKGWARLGHRSSAAPTSAQDPRWWQRIRLSVLSPEQWSLLALLVAGYFGTAHWYEQRDLDARAEVLRQMLDLPAGTRFAEFQSLKSSAMEPRIAAKVRFTEPQFNTFIARLDTAPRWQAGPPHYDGAPVEMISPETIRWRDVPLPVQAGTHFVNWTKLSAAEIRSLRRGRAVCIALQFIPGGSRTTRTSTVPRFAARDCSDTAKSDRVSVIALGALDFDTRTLHVLIN